MKKVARLERVFGGHNRGERSGEATHASQTAPATTRPHKKPKTQPAEGGFKPVTGKGTRGRKKQPPGDGLLCLRKNEDQSFFEGRSVRNRRSKNERKKDRQDTAPEKRMLGMGANKIFVRKKKKGPS